MNQFLQGNMTTGDKKSREDQWWTLRHLVLNFHCCIILAITKNIRHARCCLSLVHQYNIKRNLFIYDHVIYTTDKNSICKITDLPKLQALVAIKLLLVSWWCLHRWHLDAQQVGRWDLLPVLPSDTSDSSPRSAYLKQCSQYRVSVSLCFLTISNTQKDTTIILTTTGSNYYMYIIIIYLTQTTKIHTRPLTTQLHKTIELITKKYDR